MQNYVSIIFRFGRIFKIVKVIVYTDFVTLLCIPNFLVISPSFCLSVALSLSPSLFLLLSLYLPYFFSLSLFLSLSLSPSLPFSLSLSLSLKTLLSKTLFWGVKEINENSEVQTQQQKGNQNLDKARRNMVVKLILQNQQ